ncbi:MAG: alpha/beta hydrolase [Pirellulaceae bacterium]
MRGILPLISIATILYVGSLGVCRLAWGQDVAAQDTRSTDPAPVKAVDRVTVLPDQVYVQRDGKPLLVDIYLPPGEGPFPGILMVHGGAWASGARGHMAGHAMYLAQHGYAVAAISYRLAPVHQFPAQLDDCVTALKWLHRSAEKFQIDPTRIGGYGYSAGAHLVCLLATQTAEDKMLRLSAIVAGGTPADFTREPLASPRFKFFFGGTRAELPEVYRAASPVSQVSEACPPMFLFHGTADRVVPLRSTELMVDALKEVGVTAELHLVEGGGHMGAFINRAARSEALKFLDRKLKI